MQVEEGLDDTQVTELGRKRWKEDNVAENSHSLRGGGRGQSYRRSEGYDVSRQIRIDALPREINT